MKNGRNISAGTRRFKAGSALVLVVLCVSVLMILGGAMLTVSFGVRHRAAMVKNEAAAMLAAEAGHEKAIFWMSQQKDMLTKLKEEGAIQGNISFEHASCDYEITFDCFVGARPVYRILSRGHSGRFDRVADVLVLQAVSGWDMGMCRVPSGPSSTQPVYYVDGEVIDMPLHINCYGEPDDYQRDIHIWGSPQFLREVGMSESRYTAGGTDKYKQVMDLFEGGICFDQPASKITDQSTLQTKLDAFKSDTKEDFRFKPAANDKVADAHPAVQLEFFVDKSGEGKVRITNHCTVRGHSKNNHSQTHDFRIDPEGDGSTFQMYDIYGYHYISENAETNGDRIVRSIKSSEVTPTYGGIEGKPGGQIFIDGNVIIGSKEENAPLVEQLNAVKGQITVAATGNIWIADSITVSGEHDSNGMPALDNPNILGLVAGGVVKVVDPGISEYSEGGLNNYPGPPVEIQDIKYEPVGRLDSGKPANSYHRNLPRYTMVEASITVGGSGWGAENVARRVGWWWLYGGRKDHPKQDYIVVRGTITEAVRGVVGYGSDGYNKQYYLDERLLQGILPGDIWLKGKYVSAPAGWHDYRSGN